MSDWNLKSMTPLSEYIDMIYTRLAIEMPKHTHVSRWWVELHPPMFAYEEKDGSVGDVRLKAWTEGKSVGYTANMHAVQMGHSVSVEIIEQVVEGHVAKFVEALTP